MTDHCVVCGLPVARATLREQVEHVVERAASGNGAWVLTLNTEMLARFALEPGYRELVAQADVITADGMPLVWASRVQGPDRAIPGRTTGVDFVHAFLQVTSLPRYAIIGGVEPAATLAQYSPEAQAACGYLFSGRVDLSDTQISEFVHSLRGAHVRVLFLALGVPKQDQLALKMRQAMPELVILGVGGTFEILGPQGSRAPGWMQSAGLEWLFRLGREPGRLWKRYVLRYPFGIALLASDTFRSWWSTRHRRSR